MPEIIRDGAVVEDGWTLVGLDADEPGIALPRGAIAVSLPAWQARRAELLARGTAVGVWLAPADDPEALVADLEHLSLVAVRFPKFTDGRGYSTAVLLRRSGYRGELRAFGDLGRDQLFYLSRCGFDSYALRAGANLQEALSSLNDFSAPYQASVAEPRPLFRRRADASAGAAR